MLLQFTCKMLVQKNWEERFVTRDIAEMMLESKLESLYEDDGYDYPYGHEIEEVGDGEWR